MSDKKNYPDSGIGSSVNRRNFVKLGIGAASFSAFSAVGQAKKNNMPIRVRRSRENPLSTKELVSLRNQVVKQWRKSGSGGRIALPKFEVSSNEKIVAYNLDMVNGAPEEFIGTLVKPDYPDSQTANSQNQNSASFSKTESLNKVHKRADTKAEEKEQKKQMFTTAGTDPTNWSDWDTLAVLDNYKQGDSSNLGPQNTFGWTIDYRENPQDGSTHAVDTELRMESESVSEGEQDIYWHNKNAQAKHDWLNSTNINSDMYAHGPGNTVGSSTSGYDMSVSIDADLTRVFTVGYSSSNTESNLHIDDKSSPDRAEYADHRINFSDGIVYNTINVNTASAADVEYQYTDGSVFYPDSLTVDLEATFERKSCYNYNCSYPTETLGKQVTFDIIGRK